MSLFSKISAYKDQLFKAKKELEDVKVRQPDHPQILQAEKNIAVAENNIQYYEDLLDTLPEEELKKVDAQLDQSLSRMEQIVEAQKVQQLCLEANNDFLVRLSTKPDVLKDIQEELNLRVQSGEEPREVLRDLIWQ